MTSLVTTWISSLLPTFSDELGFVANNKTNVLVFPFSDDLFSLLIVTFNDEAGFVTNSVTSSTFSDKSVCCKKLKLLATNKFVAIGQFGFAATLSFG